MLFLGDGMFALHIHWCYFFSTFHCVLVMLGTQQTDSHPKKTRFASSQPTKVMRDAFFHWCWAGHQLILDFKLIAQISRENIKFWTLVYCLALLKELISCLRWKSDQTISTISFCALAGSVLDLEKDITTLRQSIWPSENWPDLTKTAAATKLTKNYIDFWHTVTLRKFSL